MTREEIELEVRVYLRDCITFKRYPYWLDHALDSNSEIIYAYEQRMSVEDFRVFRECFINKIKELRGGNK